MTKLIILAVAMASFPAIALAQGARSQTPSYCFDLSRVVDLAMTKERFASIASRPRQGSFQNTSLVLAGWKDCSLYGAATYTCDSSEMDTAEEAEKARAAILNQVKVVSARAGPRPPSDRLPATSFCTTPRARFRSR